MIFTDTLSARSHLPSCLCENNCYFQSRLSPSDGAPSAEDRICQAGHTFDCNPDFTSIFDPSSVLHFGPGPACNSVLIRFYSRPFRNSLSHPAFNPDFATSHNSTLRGWVHAPPSHVVSADLALEEEVIEVVADDVNDNVAVNTANQSTPVPPEDVSTLHTEQSANKRSESLWESLLCPCCSGINVSSSSSVSEPLESSQFTQGGRSRPLETSELTKVSEINQSLLRLLECPVCLEFMEPPMSQCRRGHLVCSSCRARIISCPICRTAFSSVRNRAMEAVSEIVRYPCRHGCGRETRLRRRETHEANCANRTYSCPVVSCSEHTRYPHSELQLHYQDKHASLLRQGESQTFTLKLNQEHNEQWLLKAHNELFHVGIDITMNSWSLFLSALWRIGLRDRCIVGFGAQLHTLNMLSWARNKRK
ncbi:E3 ubiquitin-protein ligase SIAH1 [Eumeta japonica]|uniref:E3 ubiquitin-protein ligase SIAH1 n=1 Tax=Eumeta variegata TaxID=151549 RepID=A0A4C1V1Y7_EUMVA|nr:E3 ubiquitin-protein ligase SIAH1 [Eumeta japonica]